MTFKPLYIDEMNYYAIGIDEDTNEYLLQVTITDIGWYDLYFRLTDKEIESFYIGKSALVMLAKRMAVDKGQKYYKDRLVG